MKHIYTIFFSLLFTSVWGQNILFVDDNDNITANSDSVLTAMQNTSYSTFDYYNIADSTANPTAAYLSNYDLVIWYASTDGGGLGFWSDGTAGNTGLTNFLIGGGKLWVIGSDILYGGGYTTPNTFAAGDFAFDYMGLNSYNVQSYGDDGSIGVAEVSTLTSAPTYFPDTLTWIFPTAWYFDGISSRASATDIYQMGPSSYVLAGEVTMTHFKDIETNTLSTFFDPALISNMTDMTAFMEQSIFYLMNFDLGIAENEKDPFSIFPNPTNNSLNINLNANVNTAFTIFSSQGKLVKSGNETSIDVSKLDAGMYFITIAGQTQRFTKM